MSLFNRRPEIPSIGALEGVYQDRLAKLHIKNMEEYEICKRRGHEEYRPAPDADYATQMNYAMSNDNGWKRCRWCGREFNYVWEKKQVERETK